MTAIARSNANSLCRGLLYEPKVPTQLKIRLGGIDYDVKKFKQKIAKVGIGLFCAGCVFLSSAAYSQAASYTAYALKLNKTNNFTSMHAKTTSDDYITNEVTAITNTSYANFWAVNNSKSKISNKYKQGVGTGSCNLIFTKSGYNSTNTQVGMGMENYQSQLSTAFVSGNVDFR